MEMKHSLRAGVSAYSILKLLESFLQLRITAIRQVSDLFSGQILKALIATNTSVIALLKSHVNQATYS